MKFELRIPLGSLFVLYGLMLTLYGLMSDPAQYTRSLGINVNLIWGLVMLAGGGITLLFAFISRNKQQGSAS